MAEVEPSPLSTPSISSVTSEESSPSVSSPSTPPNLHQNSVDPAAKWLVQKFGGTSVGKFAEKIAEDIVSDYLNQHKVAVVCSARSGSTKALGTTNLLLKAASEALKRPRGSEASGTNTGTTTPNGLFSRLSFSSPDASPRPRSKSSPKSDSPFGWFGMSPANGESSSFNATVDIIRSEHMNAARSTIRNTEILKELESEIEYDCDQLRSFLFAAQVIDEISPRSRDSIVGFGERLGCKLVAAVLRDRGIDAEFVSLESILPIPEDGDLSSDETLGQEFYDRVAITVGERIRQCGPRVPVVTGFFGPVPGSLLRQVGRGYTDLLAALLAVGLQASELQIWKEVDGIFTADPRKVPTARLIPIISPEEAAELTYYGSEVVHPFTMEQVIRKRIPIRIKNVENPLGGGTVIHPDPDIDAVSASQEAAAAATPAHLYKPLTALVTGLNGEENLHHKLPTAVTIKEHIVVLNLNSNRKSVSHGFLAGIFGVLDRFGVVVDLISTSEVHVSMAIEDHVEKKVMEKVVRELRKYGTATVKGDMAILSLVGKQMRNLVGIAGRMFTTLGQGGVNIEMISQGANEINISCVIDGRDAVKALNLIHKSCLQIRPEGAQGRGEWFVY
ncbi:hypothetical protein EIP86_007337 [Pleurotus ostreatoroseus]|nr:hypothetical protein EIP86_007337 [Pleurotus ostreatoroseus]